MNKTQFTHVYPVGDAEKHNTESQGSCWCNPTLEQQGDGDWIIVHNSLDGREKKERNEKPN